MSMPQSSGYSCILNTSEKEITEFQSVLWPATCCTINANAKLHQSMKRNISLSPPSTVIDFWIIKLRIITTLMQFIPQ